MAPRPAMARTPPLSKPDVPMWLSLAVPDRSLDLAFGIAGRDSHSLVAPSLTPGQTRFDVLENLVVVKGLAVSRENPLCHQKLYTGGRAGRPRVRLEVLDGGLELGV